eukprot:m.419821 g.419821  ORF g.419821 m.419821 type:complete len:64 (-) comp21309_c0_seq7:111-302(-)
MMIDVSMTQDSVCVCVKTSQACVSSEVWQREARQCNPENDHHVLPVVAYALYVRCEVVRCVFH